MAMGIVSDSDFDNELEKLNPSSSQGPTDSNQNSNQTGVIQDAPGKGRGTGNKEVPETLRRIIGEESAINGRQSGIELASQFGISPSSVSAYDVGANSTTSYAERPNQSFLNQQKEKVSKRARVKLMLALSKLTEDKLNDTKARELAGIAKDMSAVIKNMESDNKTNEPGQNGPTFIFYSPQMRKEESYQIVQTKE